MSRLFCEPGLVFGTLIKVALVALLLLAEEGPLQVAAADGPACDGWENNVVGPSDRSVAPVTTWWSDGTPTGAPSAAGLRLSEPGPGLIVDFGRVVSGKIEADVAASSGAPVSFSTSESVQFLAPGSDTQVYGNGDIVYRPSSGYHSWHAFARRTFRYLLVRLLQPGWIDFERIGMYHTALLGSPADLKGYFQSSDPLLNRIWFQSAYTVQLVSAAGSSSALDGTLEIWRGQLDMAAAKESRLLLAAGGADWHDYTFDFDLTIPPGSAGGGWAVRVANDEFLAFRLATRGSGGESELQVWKGGRAGSAAFVVGHPLDFSVQPGRAYHVRVDAARTQIITSINQHVVSSDDAMGFTTGGVGFWAASGDEFDVAHPRVFGAEGALLFEDTFDTGVYLDPMRWPEAPQAMLLDGAKRDRDLGMADLAITARSQYSSFGAWDAVGKLLLLVGSRQYADGKIPGGLTGNGPASPEDAQLPDYTFWWILAVGDYVDTSGDLQTVNALFPHIQAALAWANARRGPDGLLPKGPGADWYWSASRGSGPTTSLNALYVGSLQVAAKLADKLQLGQLRDTYLSQATDIRDAMNANLWDAMSGAYIDGDLRDHHPLDGNALAVLYGIAPPDRAASAMAFSHDKLWTPVGGLAADLPYGAWAQDGAVWPAYVWLEVEARFSMHDDANALDLIRRTWGSMLERDPSSTFWEYAMQDGSIHDGSTSLAHGWSTGALSSLSHRVLGVRPVLPGYAEYVIAPHPGDLDWACGDIPTPAGPIQISWQRDGSTLTVSFEAPNGTSGRFIAPAGLSDDQALLDGTPVDLAQLPFSELGLIGLTPGPHKIEVQL